MVEPQTKTLYLSDDINNETISEICEAIILINKTDDILRNKHKNYLATPIHLYINSHGGYVDDMWSLISLIEASKTPIYTYCTGYEMSAGFMIFIAGHKRFISKYARLMYHQLSGGTYGTYQDMQENVEDCFKQYTSMKVFVMKHTKIPKEKLNEIRLHKMDWYMNADEAIKYGCADEVMNHV